MLNGFCSLQVFYGSVSSVFSGLDNFFDNSRFLLNPGYIMNKCYCSPMANMLTMSNFGCGWTASPAIFSIILSLSYIFFKCNLPSKYYRYTTEIVPICTSKALVMFQSVVYNVAHSKVEGNTRFLFLFLSDHSHIHELGQNKVICRWSYMGMNVLKYVELCLHTP
jgi:hypothetical protein